MRSFVPGNFVFQTWQRHMNSSGVSGDEYTEANRLTLGSVSQADIRTPLRAFDIDQLGAKTVGTFTHR